MISGEADGLPEAITAHHTLEDLDVVVGEIFDGGRAIDAGRQLVANVEK